jgi:general secretion pathway protein G
MIDMWRQRRVKGFTLIEVLVVLSIIGVLVSFVAPMVLDRPDQARRLKLAADFEVIASALGMYRLDQGEYPADQEGLQPLFDGDFRYLASEPIDPWGSAYQYRKSASGEVIIVSSGPNRVFEGGQGDDVSHIVSR